ncbi:hypothetical protein SISNIDRAFT_415423, partial [Sistotremastrum niveocremeum HHB9708]
LTEEERKLFALYGKLPSHKNALTKMQKDRKYFDSGDYALSKAGVAPQTTVGTAIPNPEKCEASLYVLSPSLLIFSSVYPMRHHRPRIMHPCRSHPIPTIREGRALRPQALKNQVLSRYLPEMTCSS